MSAANSVFSSTQTLTHAALSCVGLTRPLRQACLLACVLQLDSTHQLEHLSATEQQQPELSQIGARWFTFLDQQQQQANLCYWTPLTSRAHRLLLAVCAQLCRRCRQHLFPSSCFCSTRLPSKLLELASLIVSWWPEVAVKFNRQLDELGDEDCSSSSLTKVSAESSRESSWASMLAFLLLS